MKERLMEEMVREVRRILGSEAKARLDKFEANNGMEMNTIIITGSESRMDKRIYIDKLLYGVESGIIDIMDAARIVVNTYDEDNKHAIDLAKKLDKRYILDHVTYKVVNLERNARRLENMPYKKVLDLAAIYTVILEEDKNGIASTTINDEHCKMFGIDEKELNLAAWLNTQARGFSISSMASTLEKLTDMEDDEPYADNKMWVMSNPSNMNGAAVIIYKGCFENLAQKIESDLYILPSSIHELIAVPVEGMEKDELREMVRNINNMVLSQDEVLSENVYKYERVSGSITIA